MNENDHLAFAECQRSIGPRAEAADGSLSRPDTVATAKADKSARSRCARSALAVGDSFMAATGGQKIQLTRVAPDFVHWINPATGSTGRMMRAYFLNFYTYNHAQN